MKAESKFYFKSKNGRIYTKDCFKNIKDKIPVTLRTNTDTCIDLGSIIGYASIKDINDDNVSLNIDINGFEDFFDDISIVPYGYGKVKDSTIIDYKFICFNLIPKKESALTTVNVMRS